MDLSIGNLKPSVCVDAVFEGQPIDEAIATVAGLGYQAFEFWCWWEKDKSQLLELCEQYSLTIASCCTKFISLVDSARRSEYLDGLNDSILAAKDLSCTTLISQVGDFMVGVDRQSQQESLVAGLVEAATLLEGTGITLVIEPLNEKVDHAGYFLVKSDEAFEIVDQVNSPNVKVVFDIYHQQISEGDLLTHILPNISRIGHFHAAGNPGRNEPFVGEINYPEIFKAIGKTEFDGFVGLEYWPKQDPKSGLGEIANWFS